MIQDLLNKYNLTENEPMSKHTTFRIGGKADLFVSADEKSLPQLLKEAADEKIPVTIIGNGSNLLVGDGGIRGLVIEIGKGMDNIEISDNVMTVGAGTLLSKAANAAATHGLSGMEFAAGIPGSVGGAVVMNAGAYGGEMKDIIMDVDVITREGEYRRLSLEELELSYRHSCIIENEYIVVRARLMLQEKDETQIRQVMEDLKNRRIEKQPLNFPSAGSTFKRPEGYFAGKLIMDAGLRGYSVGGAQVSEKHCGFVINKGDATATDVVKLMNDVRDKVMEEFGVELEPEVKMIGEFN